MTSALSRRDCRGEIEPPTAHTARTSDRSALAAFRCSTGNGYEDLVEEYINQSALDHVASSDPAWQHELLLFRSQQRVVAVASHHLDDFRVPHLGLDISGTYVEVVAIATPFQHFCLKGTHEKLSSHVMRSVVERAVVLGRAAAFRAAVHKDNRRSIALLERFGLVDRGPADFDPDNYRSYIGTMPSA